MQKSRKGHCLVRQNLLDDEQLQGIEIIMLHSEIVSPAVRQAVLEQLKKGSYKMPSAKSFNIEPFGNVGHVIYAGNM